MHDLKRVYLPQHLAKHDRPEGSKVAECWLVVPDSVFDRRHQACRSPRVARREEGNLVATAHQFLGEGMDDPLSTAVAGGGHGLERGRDLRDTHATILQS